MYDYITLTQTNIDGSISPFANGASGLILLGTGTSTPPQWSSLADAGIATKTYVDNTFLPLSGGTLRGALTGTTASFSGGVTATGGFTGDLTGTASNADKVANTLSIQLGTGTPQSYDGSAVVSLQVTPATIGAALAIHEHALTDITSAWPTAGLMVSNGTTVQPTSIAWPSGTNSDGAYLLLHYKNGTFTDTWEKFAGISSGAGILHWTGTGTGATLNLLQTEHEGYVLARTSSGYGFISLGSAIVPPITELQSDSTSPGKILIVGASPNYAPTWDDLTNIPTGLSAGIAKIDSNGKLTSGSVALGGSEVSGTLGVTNGGTGLSTLGSANQVLTSDGSQMIWANKANAAVTADKVAHKLYFTVKNGNTTTAIYFDGSADIDGGDRIPIQRTHAAGVLLGDGTAWTSSATPGTIAGVTKQVLVAVDAQTQWNYEFEPISSVLPAITGLSSGSQNAGYILTVGAASDYAPTWIPRTDLNIPSAPSSLPLVDNETGALGTAGTYANADHQHPLPYSVQAAYKFYYPRKIGIGGAITAEAQEYDGTSDLILQVTEIDPYAIINTVPIEKGGTGATTASAALTNLGAAASNHNHDSTYLKLSGGNMTGTINTPANITPLNWVGKSGVATFVSGDLTAQDNVNSYVTGRRQNINLYDSDVSSDSASPTTINHTAKNDTTVNIICGINEVRRYTRYINLPTPTADMLGDTVTIYFTNQKPSVIAELFATCSTNYRIKSYDYSNFGNTAGVDANCKWSSGNVVQFTCINLENNGTTYYWRAVKLVEQSW